jgi:D-alanyl-lipoteichoic acid acyltransferase DltB (MBOAT superfamily)
VSFLSFHFLLFLVAVVLFNWVLRFWPTRRKDMLLVASYYFYMAWDWRFASVLVLLTIVNFAVGRQISGAASPLVRRRWLALALAVCLGVLAYFKYAGFFVDELVALARRLGFAADAGTFSIVLPLGISFFTFQSLSYVLDVYRGQAEECTDLRDFALFVAFFPTVQAGPITRSRQLLPQFRELAPPSPIALDQGLALIVRGFVKKVLFADVLAAHLVTPAFSAPGDFSPVFLLIGLYAYTFQIYMDVSAYTDIARGSALMCGFRLPENFDRPYIAATVSNFWQRWHMTMSGFFRDYLYFGLGGSQRGNVYLNLMLTFLAIGVWHGAGWNFVVYGLIHGSVVCLERLRRERRLRLGLEPEPTGGLMWLCWVALTFHIVVFSRVLFRAPDLSSALNYLQHMLSPSSANAPINMLAVGVLVAAALLQWFAPKTGGQSLVLFMRLPILGQASLLIGVAFLVMALSIGSAPFVYFQF